MQKSKLFLSIFIFSILLAIVIPKNPYPLNSETESSSTIEEPSTNYVPFDDRPNDN